MSVTTFTQEEVTRSTNIKAFLRTRLFISQQSSTREGKRGALAALCMMCNPEVCEQKSPQTDLSVAVGNHYTLGASSVSVHLAVAESSALKSSLISSYRTCLMEVVAEK